MPRPRTATPDAATLRRRAHHARQQLGLVVVSLTVHRSWRATLERMAQDMQEPAPDAGEAQEGEGRA